jgi:carboxymethylenebutenolidase
LLTTDWLQYGENGEYLGYAAYPSRAKGPLPAVMVIQEIWGVDEHIQDVTRRYANAGYFAFAPDLYVEGGARKPILSEERVQMVKRFLDSLSPQSWHDAEEREKALEQLPENERGQVQETLGALFGGLNVELYRDHLLHAVRFLREKNEWTKGQRVGSVGFCLGGALSGMLAAMEEVSLSGAVIYYGNAPKPEWIPHINCPVLGFYGGRDRRISDQVPAFADAMKEAGKSFESHVYDDAAHAFFNDTRRSYDVNAARDSFARTIAFFNAHVGSSV